MLDTVKNNNFAVYHTHQINWKNNLVSKGMEKTLDASICKEQSFMLRLFTKHYQFVQM